MNIMSPLLKTHNINHTVSRLSSAIKQAPKTNQLIEIKGLLGSQSVSLQSVEGSPLALVQVHSFCVPSSCKTEKSNGLGRIRSLLLCSWWEYWRCREMHRCLCASWLVLWTLTGTEWHSMHNQDGPVCLTPGVPPPVQVACKVELLITENFLRFYLFLFYIYECFTCVYGCVPCACCTCGGQRGFRSWRSHGSCDSLSHLHRGWRSVCSGPCTTVSSVLSRPCIVGSWCSEAWWALGSEVCPSRK